MNVIKPPEGLSLQINAADGFRKWWQRFEIYIQDLGLSTDTIIKAILLHTIDADTLEIYNTFSLSEEDSSDYVRILDILEQHFIPTANETVVSYVFFSQGETLDTFVTELRGLSADCKFGDMRDSWIRDRIIIGLRDVQLLQEPNLDLLKCINISCAAELANIQTRQMKA
ncbi:hypothetical protein PR048_016088 [Dryococelus australis]|uniref:Uncharacterized protein n=1 Tax=Dryococelus australis TaxID=614101 RepID=A0ABQ9HIR6_9NEOP|nr:hypothetical protein PR048_016088 [Dryococelus australis]